MMSICDYPRLLGFDGVPDCSSVGGPKKEKLEFCRDCVGLLLPRSNHFLADKGVYL